LNRATQLDPEGESTDCSSPDAPASLRGAHGRASAPPLPGSATTPFTPLAEVAEVFVVLVSYNTAHLLQRCIDHLRMASAGLKVSVVIVDNASRDGSVDLLRRSFTDCEVIANTANIGFGRANNQALSLCNAPFVLLLNPDAYVSEAALRHSLRHMKEHPRCGVLGLRLVNEAGVGNSSVRDFPSPLRNFALYTGLARRRTNDLARAHGADHVDCDWVTGCFYLVRRTTIDEVGLFDPRYFLYFEEVDHCRATRQAGWKIHCLLSTTVVHEGGASALSGGELTAGGRQLLSPQIEGELLYFRKHGGIWGVALVVLSGLAIDAIVGLKGFIRHRETRHLRSHLRHAQELCRLALATRGGRVPVR
jgi:N-acetylglucosaminyl-diphospho-decaprenol L-rhamnosyltransferase